jgi:hypothetical protein
VAHPVFKTGKGAAAPRLEGSIPSPLRSTPSHRGPIKGGRRLVLRSNTPGRGNRPRSPDRRVAVPQGGRAPTRPRSHQGCLASVSPSEPGRSGTIRRLGSAITRRRPQVGMSDQTESHRTSPGADRTRNARTKRGCRPVSEALGGRPSRRLGRHPGDGSFRAEQQSDPAERYRLRIGRGGRVSRQRRGLRKSRRADPSTSRATHRTSSRGFTS